MAKKYDLGRGVATFLLIFPTLQATVAQKPHIFPVAESGVFFRSSAYM
jgi:hypothetical protein